MGEKRASRGFFNCSRATKVHVLARCKARYKQRHSHLPSGVAFRGMEDQTILKQIILLINK